MTEAQHQAAIFKWSRQPDIRARWPEIKLLFHIPNGGRRDAIAAKNLQRQGVKAGVPDLCLPVARGEFHGLYIELKAEGGKTSEAQCWWLEELNGQDYAATVCHGWQGAVAAIEEYLTMKG